MSYKSLCKLTVSTRFRSKDMIGIIRKTNKKEVFLVTEALPNHVIIT